MNNQTQGYVRLTSKLMMVYKCFGHLWFLRIQLYCSTELISINLRRLLCWNNRCMGRKWTIIYLREIWYKHKPDFLYLSETEKDTTFFAFYASCISLWIWLIWTVKDLVMYWCIFRWRERYWSLYDFASISGLHINAAKSSLYASGSGIANVCEEAERAGIEVGQLPIRYMGLPLTTKALSKEDYEPLIDTIRTRMLSWTNKSLSYAGRSQLLNSVISSIVSFWSSAFILPMSCLDTIESLCSAFIWAGDPHQTHKAKVKWDDLCYPKSEGGLDIRRLQDTVRVFALSLIWQFFNMSDSLWVSWVQHYLLHHSSFWDVREETTGSWIWRKLLKLCPLACQFIRVEVGNGEKAFFWHDDWLRIGKLIELTGATGTRYLGIVRSARVCDAVVQGQWRVRGQRSRHFQDLHAKVQAEPVPNQCMGEDRFLWRIQQGCVLCGERDETRDHLFFACPYSYTVWDRVVGKLMGRRINPDWSDMLRYIRNGAANLKNQVLISLLFQVVVYHIWRERNLRRHQQGQKGTELMISTINKTVKNRISSLGYEADHRLEGLLRRWFEVFD